MSLQAEKPRYWMGEPPAKCDACEKPITSTFIDGATRSGRWGCFCPPCFWTLSGQSGVGPGTAQVYVRQDDGRWLKTAG